MNLLFYRIFSLMLVTLTGWIILPGCGNKIETTNIAVDSTTRALMSATQIDVIFSDSGYIEARVTAPLVYRYMGKDPWLEFPDGFHVDMYDSIQRIETTINARYGKRVESTRIMEAKGDVVVRNELKKEQLNTEILIWDESHHTIYTEAPVRITTPGKILLGDGLESNETFSRYKILRPRGEMKVKKDSI